MDTTTITLKGGSSVNLVEVERDDEVAVIGTTDTGKRFVARRESIAVPLPPRHPFRVYLRAPGDPLRVVNPAFEEVEAWFLGSEDPHDELEVMLESGFGAGLERGAVLSVLSAMPEDQARAEGVEREAVASE